MIADADEMNATVWRLVQEHGGRNLVKSKIAEELAKLGHEIDRKIIVVKDAVKEVGSYKAIVKLHKEVSVEIPFEVVAE